MAVEIDRHLLPALREVVEPHGVTVVAGDALTLDWADVLEAHDRWALVANLPYNVATPLVCDLLDEVPAIDRMLIMVQREVGERLAAGPGDAAYGIPSVKVAYWATAEIVGRVPPTVFLPQPKVDSALVRGDPPPDRRRSRPTPIACSPWCAPRSASAARCCGVRWRAWSRPSSSNGPASARRPAPRSWASSSGVA